MSENSKIEWCDHTFNPWVGCSKVSPACDHCYAETWAKRAGTPELWQGERRRTSPSNWRQPLKWNANHERFYAEYGRRQRVFCASLADIFDNQAPQMWRDDFWQLVRDTPNIDWLLLTKRPQNILRMLPEDWGDGYPNVWLGATMEDQKQADLRMGWLMRVPAVIHFVSAEPLLGEIDMAETFGLYEYDEGQWALKVGSRWAGSPDWIITGGESGPGARPSHPDWFRKLRDQCKAAGVAFHFKQWGAWAPMPDNHPLPRNLDNVGWFTVEGFCPHEVGAAYEGEPMMMRVTKAEAGRHLDGQTWDEFPEVRP
ncbi:phage Gp37/Gp68 family protein [Paenibacillus cymbidii]|uniref:phage Gp37/Gp68 family protein n=1 Tax=Paenibacillus cymbidii TaxID=1639034 RepID=UPI0010820496|nr:phage Gp37/Gp68 family protein [Paenibacillus cymbidii]